MKLWVKRLEKLDEERDLGVIVSKNFKVSEQCIKAASRSRQILGLINRTITCKIRR